MAMSDLPQAVWTGMVKVGDLELEVSVLDDGRRIIHAESMERFLAALTVPKPVETTDVMARCWKCNEDMDDDNDAHLIEAYETTGQIMCASCWDRHCECQHG